MNNRMFWIFIALLIIEGFRTSHPKIYGQWYIGYFELKATKRNFCHLLPSSLEEFELEPCR